MKSLDGTKTLIGKWVQEYIWRGIEEVTIYCKTGAVSFFLVGNLITFSGSTLYYLLTRYLSAIVAKNKRYIDKSPWKIRPYSIFCSRVGLPARCRFSNQINNIYELFFISPLICHSQSVGCLTQGNECQRSLFVNSYVRPALAWHDKFAKAGPEIHVSDMWDKISGNEYLQFVNIHFCTQNLQVCRWLSRLDLRPVANWPKCNWPWGGRPRHISNLILRLKAAVREHLKAHFQ